MIQTKQNKKIKLNIGDITVTCKATDFSSEFWEQLPTYKSIKCMTDGCATFI